MEINDVTTNKNQELFEKQLQYLKQIKYPGGILEKRFGGGDYNDIMVMIYDTEKYLITIDIAECVYEEVTGTPYVEMQIKCKPLLDMTKKELATFKKSVHDLAPYLADIDVIIKLLHEDKFHEAMMLIHKEYLDDNTCDFNQEDLPEESEVQVRKSRILSKFKKKFERYKLETEIIQKDENIILLGTKYIGENLFTVDTNFIDLIFSAKQLLNIGFKSEISSGYKSSPKNPLAMQMTGGDSYYHDKYLSVWLSVNDWYHRFVAEQIYTILLINKKKLWSSHRDEFPYKLPTELIKSMYKRLMDDHSKYLYFLRNFSFSKNC